MVGYCWALLQLHKFHIDCASRSFQMLCSYFLKDNIALLTDDALALDIVMHRPKPWPSFCCHMVEKVCIPVQPPWQPPIQHPIWCVGAHIRHAEQCQSSIQDHSSVVGCWQHWLTLLKKCSSSFGYRTIASSLRHTVKLFFSELQINSQTCCQQAENGEMSLS